MYMFYTSTQTRQNNARPSMMAVVCAIISLNVQKDSGHLV